jgi:hypothetical protein
MGNLLLLQQRKDSPHIHFLTELAPGMRFDNEDGRAWPLGAKDVMAASGSRLEVSQVL